MRLKAADQIHGAGHVTVAYALFQDARYNGKVLIGRSDDGTHFSAPEAQQDAPIARPHPVVR